MREASQCYLLSTALEPGCLLQLHCSLSVWTSKEACGTTNPETIGLYSHRLASAKASFSLFLIKEQQDMHYYLVDCVIIRAWRRLTLSYFCSFPRLTSPPQKREVPRTRRRLERTEPKSEHFNTSIFPSCKAKSAMMSSVTFPQVALRSPPTANFM